MSIGPSKKVAYDRNVSIRYLLWLFLGAVSITQLALQLTLLTKSVAHITTLVTIDDTYYYLQTVWNLKTLGFTTFDGLNPTNGVQFFWFLLLTGLAYIAPTKEALLYGSVLLCALLNALCYGVIGLIYRETVSQEAAAGRPLFALALAFFWSLQTFYIKEYLFGMENSLHALIFWCVLWQFVRFVHRAGTQIKQGEEPNLWGLTFVLLLNGWARLDSALFSAIFYGYAIALWFWRAKEGSSFFVRHHRMLAGTSLFAGVGFAAQMISFYIMGGSFLPVSALVKSTGVTRGWQPDSFEALAKYLRLSFPPDIVGADLPGALIIALGLVALITPIVLLIRIRKVDKMSSLVIMYSPVGFDRLSPRGSTRLPSLLHLWLCYLLAYTIYHAVVLLSGAEYQGYFTWYRSPLYIFWIFGFALTLSGLVDLWLGRQPAATMVRFVRWATLLVLGLVALLSGARYTTSEMNQAEVPIHLYSVRYESAQWLQANYPPETIFAAWNAGQLGYFSEHSVVNLDGLINSSDYFTDVLAGDKPIETYLHEQGIEFIVDYEDNPLTRSLQVVHEFPQVGKRKLKIWRVK